MSSVELLLPGLLGPVRDREAVAPVLPAMPALARLLARARAAAVTPADLEADLCRRFGVAGPPWPFAALARLGEVDGGAAADGHWLRVDPVHLRVDMTHARLFGPPVLGVSADEAQALLATLNDHLRGDGLDIDAPAPDRWYARLPAAPDLITHTPAAVAGRNIDHFLPTGADGPRWRGVMNEVQMLLHDHPVNQARAARGALPVNSIWPWGAGALPQAPSEAGPARVLADDPVARGLGGLAGSRVAALPASLDAGVEAADGHVLVADAAARDALVHGEAEAWLKALADAEQRWLAPALAALAAGRVTSVILRSGTSRVHQVGRLGLRLRRWRRARPWTEWLEVDA